MTEQKGDPLHYREATIVELDNSRNFAPLRLSMKDSTGTLRWFSAWRKTGEALLAPGVGSGPWDIEYRPEASKSGSTYNTISKAKLVEPVEQAEEEPASLTRALGTPPVASGSPESHLSTNQLQIMRQTAVKCASWEMVPLANGFKDFDEMYLQTINLADRFLQYFITGLPDGAEPIEPEPEEEPLAKELF